MQATVSLQDPQLGAAIDLHMKGFSFPTNNINVAPHPRKLSSHHIASIRKQNILTAAEDPLRLLCSL